VTITTIFFDLDDTLYPAASGLWQQIRERIGLYMSSRLAIPQEQVPILRRQLFEEYGTTLRGLQTRYTVDTADFLAFVHDVPLEEYISPDARIGALFRSLPQRKFIFTNADRAHALRVLRVLQLEDCFDGIIDVVAMDPYCKPMPQSFTFALQAAGEIDPQCCAVIDDIQRTTGAARQYGIYSILFGSAESQSDADAVMTDWSVLPEILTRRK
jgi:putative hydrolase of the HAD superfamily